MANDYSAPTADRVAAPGDGIGLAELKASREELMASMPEDVRALAASLERDSRAVSTKPIDDPARGFTGYLLRCKAEPAEEVSASAVLLDPVSGRWGWAPLPTSPAERAQIRKKWWRPCQRPSAGFVGAVCAYTGPVTGLRARIDKEGPMAVVAWAMRACEKALWTEPGARAFAVVYHGGELSGSGVGSPHLHVLLRRPVADVERPVARARRTDPRATTYSDAAVAQCRHEVESDGTLVPFEDISSRIEPWVVDKLKTKQREIFDARDRTVVKKETDRAYLLNVYAGRRKTEFWVPKSHVKTVLQVRDEFARKRAINVLNNEYNAYLRRRAAECHVDVRGLKRWERIRGRIEEAGYPCDSVGEFSVRPWSWDPMAAVPGGLRNPSAR